METDIPLFWALLPQVRRRLIENRERRSFSHQYPVAELALSLLPGNYLPSLPAEISARIARRLLETDASALPS